MRIKVETKLQGHDEVFWQGTVDVPARCWNGIREGWDDVDEYDYCWNTLADTVTLAIGGIKQYDDWYISNWEVA